MTRMARALVLTPALAAAGALALAVPARVGAQDSETVRVGDISVALTRTEQRVEGNRSSVPCSSNATSIVLMFKPPIAVEVDEGTEEALSTELRLPAESAERLEALLAFRNGLLAGAKTLKVEPLIVRASQTVEVAKEPCFDQTVVQRFRRHRFEAKPSWAVGGLFKPGLHPFRWDEHPDADYAVEAVYVESCAASCAIAGKRRPVEGRDGKPLWARVTASGGTTYLVPLFYDAKGRVIDIVPLLPGAAQAAVARAGPATGALVVATERQP